MAQRKISALSAEEAYYHSADFYFLHLQFPIQSAETDGDGKFTIQVPRTGNYVIAAHGHRKLWKDTEKYFWIQPISLEGKQERVLNLSNNNAITSSTSGTDF